MMKEEEAHAALNGQLHAVVLVSRWEHVPDGPNCRHTPLRYNRFSIQ